MRKNSNPKPNNNPQQQAAIAETTDLVQASTQVQQVGEMAPTSAAAEQQYRIQSSIAIAKRFPRNEDLMTEKLLAACNRRSFAECALYSFPRSGATVSGPSINLAKEAARLWGNIEFGLTIVREDEDSRLIRGWAYDLENNSKVSAEDSFDKVVFRRGQGWIAADERELRELTNRRGAILVRNSLLSLIPRDIIDRAIEQIETSLKRSTKENLEETRARMITRFAEIGVTQEMLEKKLGHSVAKATAEEIAQLRNIYNSIHDGASRWSDYVVQAAAAAPAKAETETNEPSTETENKESGAEPTLFDKLKPVKQPPLA